MTPRVRTSHVRSVIGGSLVLLSLVALAFVLPDASGRREQQQRARRNAEATLRSQLDQLNRYKAMELDLQKGQARVEQIAQGMPQGSLGELQWALSRTLNDLAREAGLRIPVAKYNAPNREASKGTGFETVDVEATLIGVYPALKKFMLALEKSGMPFGVTAVRLEETPEGARLTLTLRAFRQAAAAQEENAA